MKELPDPILSSFKGRSELEKAHQLPDLQFEPHCFGTQLSNDESVFFSLRKFPLLQNADVFIGVLQQNLQSSSVSGLRQILSLEDKAIFDLESGDDGLFRRFELGAVLGNLNDNQLNNKRVGSEAPRFHLEKMLVSRVKQELCLLVLGNFIDACGEASCRYKGLHFYREDGQGRARTYELFYQAPPELFERYLEDFELSLSTLRFE